VAAAPGTPAPVSGAPPAPPAAAPAPAATGTIYLQVSSSQNSDWAQALAKQLKDGGFPAKVLDPKTSDESYRVVVGPYANREDADAVGKRLGRPYFIINPGSGDT
jgi:cell division septation protein DedD